MKRIRWLVLIAVLVIVPAIGWSQVSTQQPRPATTAPKLEPVAETRLLMEGLAKPNTEGLAKLLKDKPTSVEAWTFARGQALILAETGNMLMLRPPTAKAAQEVWMARSAELRSTASKLATATAAKDYTAARAALASMANSCNRCHEAFRVQTRISPFD